MKFRVLGYILIILVLLAIASVIYYVQVAHESMPPPLTHNASVVYQNEQYGFGFDLPDSWKGYTVLSQQWTATNGKDQGPEIILRHPLWTASAPREDMPVLVLTLDQWQRMTVNQEFNIGAAPIQPTELGQNSKYVLALPARYNYDYKTGWEEVDQLVHTLKAFEPKN